MIARAHFVGGSLQCRDVGDGEEGVVGRGALYSAPDRRLRQPHRHHRSVDPVSTKTGDAWLLDPARSVRRKVGSRGREPAYPDRGNRYHVGDRLEGPAIASRDRRFVYSDEDTGRVATVVGYPTDKLTQARLGQPDGISPSRMAEMLEVDKAWPKVRC
jgi:hypothetical protein